MAKPKKTPQRKTAKMRSSPEARRLIRARVKKYKTQRAAAKSLSITQAQLNGMLTGRLRDTPGMVAQLKRAERRAVRAFYNDDPPQSMIDDCATLRAVRRALMQGVTMIDVILQQCDNGTG